MNTFRNTENQMPSGYSGTALSKKLGLKENFKMVLYNPPADYFNLITDLPPNIEILNEPISKSANFIHLFCRWKVELKDTTANFIGALKNDGTLLIWDESERALKIWEKDMLFTDAFHLSCVP
ncbi:MAG TPA: hypothetical protein VFD29_08110 [Gillisia sp.]|nr:hypothetical protein [Gillisia sp.]